MKMPRRGFLFVSGLSVSADTEAVSVEEGRKIFESEPREMLTCPHCGKSNLLTEVLFLGTFVLVQGMLMNRLKYASFTVTKDACVLRV